MEDPFNFQFDENLFKQDVTPNKDYLGLDASLGLDEEVQVKAKRAPKPKLSKALFLSAPGRPKLQKTAAKLKFRGKGNEFADLAKLLDFYQLWLDDLFPREKFADALIDVEKIGHGKDIQVLRKGWIHGEEESHHPQEFVPTSDVITGQADTDLPITPLPGSVATNLESREQEVVDPLDAILDESEQSPIDYEDALMNELHEMPNNGDPESKLPTVNENNKFDDDEAAMAEMGGFS